MNRTALLLVAFAGLFSATWAFAQGDAPAAAAPVAKGKVTGRVVYDAFRARLAKQSAVGELTPSGPESNLGRPS